MDWVSEVKRRQAAKGGYLPAGMKPSGTLSTYQPTLRERGTDFLRKMLFSDDRAGQQRAERLSDVAETVTPYGLATGMYDAGREGGQGDYATAGLMTAMAGLPGPNPKGFKAYHGSPHDFDRFSLDKIGTGEGKQAEGMGLYFAENPKVAEKYRDNLSSRLDENHTGTVYEVNINADPNEFVDWSVPLMEQPKAVQQWFNNRGITPGFAGQQSGAELLMAERGAMGDSAVAQSMKEAGIPGIKYLDAGSRTQGDGSRNYVVFDDKLIDILKKYGLFGPVVGAGAVAAQDDSAPY